MKGEGATRGPTNDTIQVQRYLEACPKLTGADPPALLLFLNIGDPFRDSIAQMLQPNVLFSAFCRQQLESGLIQGAKQATSSLTTLDMPSLLVIVFSLHVTVSCVKQRAEADIFHAQLDRGPGEGACIHDDSVLSVRS